MPWLRHWQPSTPPGKPVETPELTTGQFFRLGSGRFDSRPVLEKIVILNRRAQRPQWQGGSAVCYLKITGKRPTHPMGPLRRPGNVTRFLRVGLKCSKPQTQRTPRTGRDALRASLESLVPELPATQPCSPIPKTPATQRLPPPATRLSIQPPARTSRRRPLNPRRHVADVVPRLP